MRKKVLLSIITLSSALALSGCGNKTETPEVTSVVEAVSLEPLTEPVTQTEAVTEPETVDPYYIPEGMMRSYLTGELINEGQGNRRPVAIMLNNIIDAIPQTGISRAGVVYEAPVEGGLTRLMGIFENYDDLDKIGSVRSARTYYVYFAREFDAIYAHYGQCEYALPLLNSSEIDNISGLESVGNVAYYRTSDRKAPHNAYTSAECIQDGIDYLGYNTAYPEGYDGHYIFAQGNEVVTLDAGEDAKKVVVGYPNNKPWWNYPTKIKEVLENYTGECTVVRASRVLEGAVFDSEFFDSKRVTIPAYKFSAQKARILLMLALNCTKNHETIKSFFQEY